MVTFSGFRRRAHRGVRDPLRSGREGERQQRGGGYSGADGSSPRSLQTVAATVATADRPPAAAMAADGGGD